MGIASLTLDSIGAGLLVFLLALFFNNEVYLRIFNIFACGAATALGIAILLVKNRKLPTWSGLVNSFVCSISIDFLLKNRLAICRDYAKLTACLLSNIYLDKEIYFTYAFQHVATGIIVKDRLYVLDKWLPVVTIEKWLERWKSKKALKMLKGNCLESANRNFFLSNTKSVRPNTAKLAIEMAKLLNIKEESSNEGNLSSLKILTWSQGSMLYEDDEIVNYSLSQLIKKNILDEMLDLSQITKLEVIQDNNDLVFWIKLKLNKA